MRILVVVAVMTLWCGMARAKVRTEIVEYKDRDTALEGYLSWDDSIEGKRPGVAVVHEWTGINDYTRMRTEKLAGLGYIAFAIDIYGKGIRPTTPQAAAAQASIYKKDRNLMRTRALAGLAVLQANPLCDTRRVAAIGYCFGGTTALEIARSGADIGGVVSFHGGLDTPAPGDAKNIRCKVLVLHGADDPNVPRKDVEAFEDEMRAAKVDWQLYMYGGAVHAFTNPGAGNDNSRGVAYNEKADRRSWEAMKLFFAEIFKQ